MTISITPAEARAIGKDAYIYGFPMVDGYRIQSAYFLDKTNPQYKVPLNHIASAANVFTPADTVVQTPNSDTPYSFAGLDLRAEPVVITVPPIEGDRYFSAQLTDLYTFNFDYIGSRATGNGGGSFLIAGPGWNGPTPAGVTKVIRCETELAVAVFRTQLLSPADIDKVRAVQAGYKVEPLSAFLGQAAPTAAPTTDLSKPLSPDGRKIDFFKPLSPDDEKTSLEFFNELSFVLGFCPTDPSETALMARFAQIDVGDGKTLDTANLSPEITQALHDGMADAWAAFTEFRNTQFATGKVTATQVFGTRQYLKNNYLYRMAAAVLGIYGNTAQEAMYPAYALDSERRPLTGARNYTVRFAKDALPPVNAFWSLTMYGLPESLLVANPIDRYLLNSPMLPQFKRDADSGLTFYIQNQSPGADKEANWLPAPSGPFAVFMRLYWPKPEALDGSWTQPPMIAAG